MNTLTLITLVTTLAYGTFGYLIKVQPAPAVENFDDTAPDNRVLSTTYIQKLVLPLFENVCEVSSDPNIITLSQGFNLDPEDYLKPEVISNLRSLIANGLLPKGEIFSEYNLNHMAELKIINDLLYYANNFDVFYKAAAWARQNINCRLYVNAIYTAIQNRKDIENLLIPAPYEVLPNYFVRQYLIVQASSILAGQNFTLSDGIRSEGNIFTIDANYTGQLDDNDEDSKLAYFREDIGLNSYYYLRKLKLAPWLNIDINSNYGEQMYQTMRQLMARYNLERYANGLTEIESVDWNFLMGAPYDPMLIYSDGNEFSHRTSPLDLPSDKYAFLQNIENNISVVVDHMWQSGYNKTQILNHIMEILVTGDKSYETLARQLLGKDLSNNRASVLEHYMTSLRDPMFWRINKNIVDMIDNALKVLPPYSKNELYLPGVEITNIDVKKLVTVYDYFEFDVTNALKLEDNNSSLKVKISQTRLNHKPFTIKINISSLVTQQGLVKIYLVPNLLPGELVKKKNLFTMFDMFEVNLKKGSNLISRNSDEIKHFSKDFLSINTMYKHIEDAEYGLNSLPLKSIASQTGYPDRLILPKGSPEGLLMNLFVFVAPFFKANPIGSYLTNNLQFNEAILLPGYPLDLDIDEKLLFSLPNVLVKPITIMHKGDNKNENDGRPGFTKKSYGGNNYDPTYHANYGRMQDAFDHSSVIENGFKNYQENPKQTFKKENHEEVVLNMSPRLLNSFNPTLKFKEPFDYNAKKAQFDKKDYSTKKDYIQYRTYPSVFETTTLLEATDYVKNNVMDTPNSMIPSDLHSFFLEDSTIRCKTCESDIEGMEKSNELFDSSAKTAQFLKKVDSTKKKDYTQYQTTPSSVKQTIVTLGTKDKTNIVFDINDNRSKNQKYYQYENKPISVETNTVAFEAREKRDDIEKTSNDGVLPEGLLWFYLDDPTKVCEIYPDIKVCAIK